MLVRYRRKVGARTVRKEVKARAYENLRGGTGLNRALRGSIMVTRGEKKGSRGGSRKYTFVKQTCKRASCLLEKVWQLYESALESKNEVEAAIERSKHSGNLTVGCRNLENDW